WVFRAVRNPAGSKHGVKCHADRVSNGGVVIGSAEREAYTSWVIGHQVDNERSYTVQCCVPPQRCRIEGAARSKKSTCQSIPGDGSGAGGCSRAHGRRLACSTRRIPYCCSA